VVALQEGADAIVHAERQAAAAVRLAERFRPVRFAEERFVVERFDDRSADERFAEERFVVEPFGRPRPRRSPIALGAKTVAALRPRFGVRALRTSARAS
jgi:hypothetical protein